MRLIKIVVESFNNDSIPAVSSFSFSIDLPLDDDNKNTMVIKLSNFLHATVPESRAGPGAGDIAEGEGVCFVATKGKTKKTRGCYLAKSACLANANCQPKAYAELNTRLGKESALRLMRSTLDGP